ncbi:MAG: hypothetical protein CL810_09950 [Cobetia sp.]|nr:hypothetical protein [Cobetia sp.]MBK09864.1 hypothetical protein [Cobetia sp.]
MLVMLDSAVAGEHGGLLCESRLAWLDACLAAHHDRRILLALHHPPMALGIRYMDDIRLQNSQALHDVAGCRAAAVSWGWQSPERLASMAPERVIAQPQALISLCDLPSSDSREAV